MGQSLASLSRNFISILVCLILVACNGSYTAFEDDRDFDVDNKTVDIERDNAELKTLAVYQSAYLGHFHSAAYFFLDASDLPVGSEPTANENEYRLLCESSGSVTFTYSRNAGEPHKVGDRVAVFADECANGSGFVYSGKMSARYTKLKGLNNRFVTTSTPQCLERVQDKLNVENVNADEIIYDSDNDNYILNEEAIFERGSLTNLVEDTVLYLRGDDLSFAKVANKTQVDLIWYELIEDEFGEIVEQIPHVELSFSLPEDNKAIFVLQPYYPQNQQVTSLDGDQIYSLQDSENSRELCQGFERTLSVSFDKFATNKQDYIYTELNGSVTLFEAQENYYRINQSFIDSDFQTIVKQGEVEESFSMKDYSVEKAVSATNNTYAYEFEGMISNNSVLKGQLELTTFGKLNGSFLNTYPDGGSLEIKAKGLERIIMRPNNLDLRLQVDFDGDSTGNGFSDFDIDIFTTWSEFFDREFKE